MSTERSELLSRVADGDQDAMRSLIKRYSGLVWSLVRRKISNQTDAEDLVQEIFADIWKSAHRYDAAVGSEDTFVAMIARRRVIDQIRKITRTPNTVSLDTQSSNRDPKTTDPVDSIDLTNRADKAMGALGTLRPERRLALELAIVHGLSHSQIAESTGMPLGTVKAHLRRGLDEVRKLLLPNAPQDTGAGPDAKGVSS
ncbi:MAG: sigma-70 family RNA polymerase sigma factor [Phycisphaerales bacterium]